MKKIDINKEELINFYINLNHNIVDTAKHFNCSRDVILRLLKTYDIKKEANAVRQSIETTCMNKYGCKTNLQSEETKEKIKQTNLQKYGFEYSHQNNNVINKTKETNLQKYGNSNYLQTESVRNKVKETNIKKYGVENPFYSKEVQSNIQHKNNQLYSNNFNNKMQELGIDISTKKDYILSLINSGYKTIDDIANNSIYSYSYIENIIKENDLYNYIDLKPNYSSYEKEIVDLLNTYNIFNIERNTRKYLNGKEIDIYLPDYKIGIEFNGNYWHSELKHDKNYHKAKTNLSEELGIFLFHIYEYEWNTNKQQIINMLKNILNKNTQKIYARECTVKEVTVGEKKIFLENNHLQGNDRSKYNIGLYYQNKLVSLMTFCKPRFNKKYTYELSRFCSLSDTNVIGAASKLFKYFMNNYLEVNDTIISYSNRSKTTGKVYEILGFEKDYDSVPNYIWWFKGNIIKSRYQTQIKDEVNQMHSQGYSRIYDCGQRVWKFKKK